MSKPQTWECRYVPLDYEPQDGEHVTPIPHAPHAFYSMLAVKEVVEVEQPKKAEQLSLVK